MKETDLENTSSRLEADLVGPFVPDSATPGRTKEVP
jgi:hypothetical protein